MQHQRHLQSERGSAEARPGGVSVAASSSAPRVRRVRRNFCGCHGGTAVSLVAVTAILAVAGIRLAEIARREMGDEAFPAHAKQTTWKPGEDSEVLVFRSNAPEEDGDEEEEWDMEVRERGGGRAKGWDAATRRHPFKNLHKDFRDMPHMTTQGFLDRHREAEPTDLFLENEDADPALILKLCSEWLNQHEIKPDESWGSAPKSVQQAWEEKKCNRVLGEEGFSYGDPPTRSRSRAIVVVWTSLRGWLEYLRPKFVKGAREECPTECIFTDDRGRLGMADGVVFHASTHGKKNFPPIKPPGAQYVFVNLEPVTYPGVIPLLRDRRYMSRFDLSMTYQRNSDIPLGYVSGSPASRYFESEKLSFQEKDGFGEPSAIAAFVSNCKQSGASRRATYMGKLMTHTIVHSYGKCHHNRKEPQIVGLEGTTNRQQNKIEVLRHYKFLLAFENNDQLRDYVTEKVYNGLQAGTLPVYWGAENIEDYVPRGSVLKVSDFESPEALAAHLKMLSENEEAYESYFRWRGNATELARFQEEVVSHSAYSVNAMCRLCDRLVRDRGGGFSQ